MTLRDTSTGYEPNVSINGVKSEMGTSGARFVPTVDLTRDDDDTNSHMSDVPLQLPVSAHVLVTFAQSLTDTKSDRCKSLAITKIPGTYLQSVPAVLEKL